MKKKQGQNYSDAVISAKTPNGNKAKKTPVNCFKPHSRASRRQVVSAMYTGPPTTYGDLSGAVKEVILIPNPITVTGTVHIVPKNSSEDC